MNNLTKLKTWIAGGLAASVLAVAGCSAASVATTTTASSTSASGATTTLTATHDNESDHDYDAASAVTIDLADPSGSDNVTVADGVITITASGVYRLTGTLADGSVVVNSTDDGTVYLILDDATITNSTGSALAVIDAKLAVIVLADGTTNNLTDGATYAATGDDDPDAALYSADDLTFLGEGTLNVTSNHKDAINSSDGIVIDSGTINVTAADDGIRGKDYVAINGGIVKVTSTGDALKSDNEEDAGLGYVSVTDGTVTLDSGDDGIDAWNAISISGGSTTVQKSVEGFEAKVITLSGGATTITSSDDGLNATDSAATGGEAAQEGTLLAITGGELTVTADGDGIDSNGDVTMSGGTVVVNGPTMNNNGALDYNGTFTITGGSLLAGGSSGMAQAPDTGSSQKSLMVQVSAQQGDTVEVKDSSGVTIATYTATRQIGSLVVSNDKVTEGETYTVYVNGTQAGTTDTSQVSNNTGGPGGGGPGGGGGGQRP